MYVYVLREQFRPDLATPSNNIRRCGQVWSEFLVLVHRYADAQKWENVRETGLSWDTIRWVGVQKRAYKCGDDGSHTPTCHTSTFLIPSSRYNASQFIIRIHSHLAKIDPKISSLMRFLSKQIKYHHPLHAFFPRPVRFERQSSQYRNELRR